MRSNPNGPIEYKSPFIYYTKKWEFVYSDTVPVSEGIPYTFWRLKNKKSDGASLSYYMNIPDEVLLNAKWKVDDVVGKRLTHPYLIDKRSLFIMQRMRGMILKDGRMDVNSEAFKGALNFLASLPAPLPPSNASTGATKTIYGQHITILYNKYKEFGGG